MEAQPIRESLKQFLGLLLIGQIFLVGAVLKNDRSLPLLETSRQPVDYVMKADPAIRPEKPKQSDHHRLSPSPRPGPAGKKSAKAPEVDETPAVVLEVTERDEKPFKLVEFTLSKPVRVRKQTHHGKLVRVRTYPALEPLPKATIKELSNMFEKFSWHQSRQYTEFLMYGKGRIGSPYIATSSAGLFQMVFPLRPLQQKFLVPAGREIVEGVTYYRDRVPTARGRSDVHILRVDPMAEGLSVIPVLANEGICQKEGLSSIARRYGAVAGINAAYFTSNGDPIGTLIINRRLISSPLYRRSVFGMSRSGKPLFGNPDFAGRLTWGKRTIDIDAVNQPRRGNQLVVFSPEYARSTLTREDGVELVLVQGRVVGIHKKDAIIPPDGVVVSAGGLKGARLAGVRLGERVSLDYQVNSPWDAVQHAVCGGPQLISDGNIAITGNQEKFSHSIVSGRHPRTAVALTKRGDLLFVVVDGRSKRNSGMTLKELAMYLQRLDAQNAINLDGGGSSTMVVRNQIVNSPSDGRERPISNGILITKSEG